MATLCPFLCPFFGRDYGYVLLTVLSLKLVLNLAYITTADATLLSKIAVMFGLLPAAASRAVEYADATCSYLVDPPVL